MKYTESLKQNYEFRRLYSKGKSAASPYLALYVRKNRRRENRLGITVGSKLGNAVKRNRVRRRLKEIYRLNEDKFRKGCDIVVVARVKAVYARYGQLEQSFLALAQRLDLLASGEKDQ
jgi:ribonuclease P protein component